MNDKLQIDTRQCPTVLDLYASYRQYLNHEHSLINQRLSWNFTIQGFLFTSYAFVLNKLADVRVALSQEAMVGVNQLRTAQHELHVLLLVIAVVGVCASITIHFSVWGARLSMNELRLRWSGLKYRSKGSSLHPASDTNQQDATTPGEPPHEDESLEQLSLSHGYPTIMGGGDPRAIKLGFHAPALLSIAIAIAWLLLIVDGLRHH
jgi:hypothetical protein